ncbi:MAG: YebC/PmpR family DNA-binding transcriptional regulator [Pseudomonadota bacterium]
MSGHSKWSSIKHKKGAADAKRSKLWTKVIKELTTAAREGGGDPSGNPRLRKAVDDAKNANMPADNIEKAIKRGTGELEGVTYESVNYGGHGPGGVMVLVETLTDNRNRTVSEIRKIFSKHNGNLGETSSVNWMFSQIGLIVCDKEKVTEDQLLEAALESGADDIKEAGATWEVRVPPAAFESAKEAIQKASIPVMSQEITKIPQNTVKIEGKDAETMLKLFEALEDHEDVQDVYANFDISDEILEKFSS